MGGSHLQYVMALPAFFFERLLDYAEVLQKLGAGNLQLRAPPHLHM
jgi:hypothetical protein